MDLAQLVSVVRAAFLGAVARFDLTDRVLHALAGVEASRVLAVGKAAPAMLAGARRPKQTALLIVPEGTPIGWVEPTTRVLLSDHPLPTERSLQAGEAAFGFVRGGDVVALISGGTSALLCAPAPGITLEEKRGIADTLIRSGASIGEINLVRRHLSRIKGGGLGAAGSGRVLTLVASDVIGGEAHEVGSGPTVVDPSTVAEARAVLDRYGLDAPLAATIGPSHPRASAFEHRFVAQPVDLAGVVRVALEAEGLTVFDMPPTGDDVESLARAYAGLATSLNPGQALVRSAEPTVAVPAKAGKGGRSTHLAALAAALLPDDVVLLCGASDGTDGASGTAGAVVTRAALARYDVARALRAFDAGSLHVAAGTHLDTRGPTGLNLCDVHVLARAAAA